VGSAELKLAATPADISAVIAVVRRLKAGAASGRSWSVHFCDHYSGRRPSVSSNQRPVRWIKLGERLAIESKDIKEPDIAQPER
jgi:hypothetical protein